MRKRRKIIVKCDHVKTVYTGNYHIHTDYPRDTVMVV